MPRGGKVAERSKHKTKVKSGKPTGNVSERTSQIPEQSRKGRRGKGGHTWRTDGVAAELGAMGLRVKEMASDGNCLFSSICDQIEGSSGNHMALRQRVVGHMRANREHFEPFVEDDVGWEEYLSAMAEEGAWAGHMELQATSLVAAVNITVHQAGQPAWTIANSPKEGSVHVSYHDGEHYNSVRLVDDVHPGPAAAIPASAGAEARRQRTWGGGEEHRVSQGTGCDDRGAVRGALQETGGNVDQAIELLIQRLADEVADGEVQQLVGTPAGSALAHMPDRPGIHGQRGSTDSAPGESSATTGPKDADPVEISKCEGINRKPQRNKACICGSSQKYKKCCGGLAAATARRLKGAVLQGQDSTVAVEPMKTLLI